MFEVLADIIALGLWDAIAYLFGGPRAYKFTVSKLKNDRKYRIRTVYFEKKKKYRITAEELSGGKFRKVVSGTFDNDQPAEEFHKAHIEANEIEYAAYEYDRLKLGELKSILDSIGWNQKVF
ncbi:MAG TPA: hypothetical protein PL169_05560 [Leptospiraceae bacterium]|nr:hypothetical protein [Leptospiraceae bacterium]